MSLNFVTADGDLVDYGDVLTELMGAAHTLVFWFKPDSISDDFRVFHRKKRNHLYNGFSAGDGARITREVRTTGGSDALSKSNTILAVGAWSFVAITYDGALTQPTIYHGSLTAAPTDQTGSGNNGSGTYEADTGSVMSISSTGNAAAGGSFSMFQIYDAELSLDDITKIWWSRDNGPSSLQLWTELGYNPAADTQEDFSGNGLTGTVTGATVSDDAPIGPPFGFDMPWQQAVASVGGDFPIDAEGGAYVITGTAANLEHQAEIQAASGSYAVTGTDANLEHQSEIQAASGSYTVSGTDANLEHHSEVAAASGAFVVTGTAATLSAGIVIIAASGSYAVTGTAASLEHSAEIQAVSGSYAVSGTAAELKAGIQIVAASGSYAVSGTAASLELGAAVVAVSGSYTVSGTDANLEHHSEIAAASGSYAISGTDANLELGAAIEAAGGAYVVSGTDANLEHHAEIQAASGSFTVSGTAANLVFGIVGTGVLAAGAATVAGTATVSGDALIGAVAIVDERPKPIDYLEIVRGVGWLESQPVKVKGAGLINWKHHNEQALLLLAA